MVKRKRAQDIKLSPEKRRHVSPEDEADGEFNSDDGTQFGTDAHDPSVGEQSDAEESGEEDGSEAEEEERMAEQPTAVADLDDEGGERRGTKPKKPPTGEELRDIKDAADLYRSSSFKLQIDALLPNVRPKYQRFAALDRFLLALHTFLNSLPSKTPEHPLVASRRLLKKGIAVPYPTPLPTEDTNWKVTFEKPDDITIVGSWTPKLSVKSQDKRPYCVDVAVEMPESMFQEKDYLNGRFFHKRAFYLSVIASALSAKKSGFNVELAFESAMGDPRLTNLIVRSKPDGSQNDFSKLPVEIRIVPTISTSAPISLRMLSPRRSNIRASSTSSESAEDTSTPLYNNTLLLSTVPRAHLLRVHSLQQAVSSFTDALTLLKVWANQRGYGAGSKLCIRGFEGKGMWWAAVLDLLINGEESAAPKAKKSSRRKPLGKGLSSYQLFRAALDFFAKHDFATEHVFLKTEHGHRFPPEEFKGLEPVFVDSTSSVNLLAGVPLGSLDLLKHDAKMTLELLNEHSQLQASGVQDPFNEVFLQDKRDLQTRFDVIMRVDLSSAKLPKASPHAILDRGSPYNALLASLVSVLGNGLGNRCKAIAVLHSSSQHRPLSQAHPSNDSIVYIGIVLDTEHAFRLVDHGPPADSTDEEALTRFRELWGDKAELRRFKDGSITESVVWEVKNTDERAQIPFSISQHLLKRHCGIPPEGIQNWQTSYDAVLRLPESISSLYLAANAQTGFKSAMTAFDKLVKGIKALDEELPLAILNVSPVCESLRYTNVFSPLALPPSLASALPACARYLPTMDIIIEFEKSGRWPDDLRAIQKIKLAFFERLGSALMNAVAGLKATVVLGDAAAVSDIVDAASLEIVTSEGWAFSARIWHDREATLLDDVIDDKPHIPKHIKRKLQAAQGGPDPKDRQAALLAKEVYTRRFIHAPRHHRAIAALSHRFSAFAGTVRLVKRWLAAHWLLHGHISEEAAELICASVFLGGTSTAKDRESVPGTKERGFALVVQFLRDWEWEKGLFVPLYGSNSGDAEDGAKRVAVVAGSRVGVWAISTEMDPEGHMWTASGPDAIVARRILAIGKASLECLQQIETEAFDVKTLFSHPTEHYDFVIQLDRSTLPRYSQNVAADTTVWHKTGKYANARIANGTEDEPLRSGFDPARLLFDDLKRVYHDTFKIFWDPLGGDRFGAVWDPSLKEPRPFRVLGGFSSTPLTKESQKSKDKGLVTLNTEAVLAEVERMGADIVAEVTVQI